jgi:hypothetical protein
MARSKSEEAEKKSEHVDQRECPGGGSDDHCMLAHEQHIGDHSDQQQATTTGKATVTVRHTCACCLRCEMFRGVRSSGSGEHACDSFVVNVVFNLLCHFDPVQDPSIARVTVMVVTSMRRNVCENS